MPFQLTQNVEGKKFLLLSFLKYLGITYLCDYAIATSALHYHKQVAVSHFSVYEKLQICIWDVPAMDSMLSFLLPLAVLRSHNTSTAALRSFGRKHKRPLCWASGPYSQREYTKTRQQFISSFSCMLQKSSM